MPLPNQILIRQATESDIALLTTLRIEIANYHTQFNSYYTLLPDAENILKSHLQTLLNDKKYYLIVAEINGKLLGYANGYITGTAPIFVAHKRGYIDEFGVTHTARRNNIGKQLLETLMLWFKNNGAERVELKVDALNNAGINFWRNNGFTDLNIQMQKEL